MSTTSFNVAAGLCFVFCVLATQAASAQNQRLTTSEGLRPQKRQLGIRATFIRLNNQGSRPFLRNQGIRPDRNGNGNGYEYGERVDRVERGSPAQRAGLERGDVIVATYPAHLRSFREHPIRNKDSLRSAVRFSGDRLKLIVKNVRTGRYTPLTIYFNRGNGQGGSRPLFRSK